MKETLHKLPKVELHRHLEGAIPPEVIFKVFKKYHLSLPAGDLEDFKDYFYIRKPMSNLQQVLDRISYGQACFRDLDAVRFLTSEVCRLAAEDNIKLLELRLSPAFMAEPSELSWESLLEEVIAAKSQVEKEAAIHIGLILIHSRNYGMESCLETMDLAIQFREDILGVDLAGPERRYPPKLFVSALEKATAHGLKITAHYGEEGPPEYVSDAIKLLGALRIGHGVATAQSQEVLNEVRSQRRALEFCPTSNDMTRAVEDFSRHPLKRMLAEDIAVSINTDDPAIFGITLTSEYERCMKELGLTLDDIKKCNRLALAHSFFPEKIKREITKKYGSFWDFL